MWLTVTVSVCHWYVCVCVCVCVCVLSPQVLLDDGHIEFKQNLRKHPEAFNEASSTYTSEYLYMYISLVYEHYIGVGVWLGRLHCFLPSWP